MNDSVANISTGLQDGDDFSLTVGRVEDFLKSQGVFFDKTQEPMFRNHLCALRRRIASGEFTEGLEDAFGEVSEQAFELARRTAELAYGSDTKAMSESEIFLLATHIEVALQKAAAEKGEE